MKNLIFSSVVPAKSYKKRVMDNWKGVTQSQIRTYILLNKSENVFAGSQQWDRIHFSMIFPYSALFSLVSL